MHWHHTDHDIGFLLCFSVMQVAVQEYFIQASVPSVSNETDKLLFENGEFILNHAYVDVG